jgi:hypothetical protein
VPLVLLVLLVVAVQLEMQKNHSVQKQSSHHHGELFFQTWLKGTKLELQQSQEQEQGRCHHNYTTVLLERLNITL